MKLTTIINVWGTLKAQDLAVPRFQDFANTFINEGEMFENDIVCETPTSKWPKWYLDDGALWFVPLPHSVPLRFGAEKPFCSTYEELVHRRLKEITTAEAIAFLTWETPPAAPSPAVLAPPEKWPKWFTDGRPPETVYRIDSDEVGCRVDPDGTNGEVNWTLQEMLDRDVRLITAEEAQRLLKQ